jgi:invasion protein IalB
MIKNIEGRLLMLNFKKITKSLILGAFASAFVPIFTSMVPVSVQAQEAPKQGWFKVCSKQGKNDICNVQYNIRAETGQLVTGVSLLTVKGEVNRKIFQVIVPTGRAIAPGIEVQIDKNKANKFPYSFCFPDRCLADIQMSDAVINALKKGNKIAITTTNFQGKKNPVNLSLKGFTAVFDGPPLKRNELAQKQKKLQEDLQKKAEETRKKLEEAQKKAKEAN